MTPWEGVTFNFCLRGNAVDIQAIRDGNKKKTDCSYQEKDDINLA